MLTDKNTFVIGDTFTVDVKLDSSDVGINAGQATITYPPTLVEVTSIDKSTSAFNFWLQGPDYKNDTGAITFIGGSQSGISGKALEVMHVTFKIKGAGAIGIIFSDGAVTASDGSGTNVLSAMTGLQLTSITKQDATLIKPPQIVRPAVATSSPPLKPVVRVPLYSDPTAWYANVSKFIAQWDLPRDVTDVATEVDQQPTFDPSASEGLFDNKTFAPLADGIWYLHVRFKNNRGWGPTLHYPINIDTAPPLPFTVTSAQGSVTENVAPAISFGTKDQPSGIQGYTILVDGIVETTTDATTTSYTLLPLASGSHIILVQALDKAGNRSESTMNIRVQEPPFITIAGVGITQFWVFIDLIVTLIAGIGFGRYVGMMEKRQRRRRIVIAQRDVQSSLDLIQKDLEEFLNKHNSDTMNKQATEEMKTLLQRIAEKVEKSKQYLLPGIEEIDA